MLLRRSSARKTQDAALPGQPQLTLAKLIVLIEATLRYFARPLFFGGMFLGLSWIGIFSLLYPWAHLVALCFFVVLFFDAIGRAQLLWRRPSLSLAMRRVEEANGLTHRPMDVIGDHPVGTDAAAHTLWQEHVLRAQKQMKNLRWPKFDIDWARRDPYRLRYAVAVMLALGLIAGWGALGGRLIAAINPALGRIPQNTIVIDAWITPPDYTHLPPIMIATPAGSRLQGEVIKVPEGSTLHAHLAEKDGTTPVLEANDQSIDFTADDEKDFEATTLLKDGNRIVIHRGWSTLGAWKVQIVPDTAPVIAFTDMPSASERRDVRIAYDAHDDYGVTSVTLRVTPRATLIGIEPKPFEVPLAALDDKEVKRVDFKDLTAEPWAGLMVDMQLIATDAVGHQSMSDTVPMTLPERIFFQPVARMLIEERKKLLANILDVPTRNEAANVMAGLAHQPASFGNDPVVMMALRAGAVRLVLDREPEAVLTAKDILWRAATRIEDGTMGMAEQNLKQAQKELADALDRNAGEKDVQALIDRLHQALSNYLAQLSTRVAAHAMPPEDLGQVLGPRSNVLTPQDLDKMLDSMKDLSASGSRDDVREELQRLQQVLENVKIGNGGLSPEQQEALQDLKELKQLEKDQQEVLDSTFQKSKNAGKDPGDLAARQQALRERLKDLMGKAKDQPNLTEGADAMGHAEKALRQNGFSTAVSAQNEALKVLRQTEQAMTQNLEQSLFGLPQAGGSTGNDPFGRGGMAPLGELSKLSGPQRFDSDRVRAILNEIQQRAGDLTRSKTERDYIERLLQNF